MNRPPSAFATEPFVLQGLTARPGESKHGYCEVDLGTATVSLPVAVLHGVDPGPVLAVTAGIHGGEYVPILAAREFLKSLDPTTMHGTVIISLQSSPSSFHERTAFVNPLDGKNLNRSFPGAPEGGPTERLASWLWNNIIARADFYVDCHCGDLPESLDSFTGIVISGDQTVDDEALAMANCFDVKRIITTSTPGSTLSAAAQTGIPAVLVELGERGMWTDDQVGHQLRGLVAVANRLGIIDCEMPEDRPVHPVLSVSGRVVAERDGLWFPKLRPGDGVRVGSTIGTIEDIFATTASIITSPSDGVYVYGLTSLAVHAGDFLASIAAPTSGDR